MPKQPKTSEEKLPETSTESFSAWWKNRWLMIGAGIIVLVAAAYFVTSLPKEDISDNQAQDEEISLADQLAQIEFDDSVSHEDQELHYLSVASAFMAEGDFEGALTQYLKAETAGQVNARLYSDMAVIYESKQDSAKQEEYLKKYIDLLVEEANGLKDQLSISGNYTAAAQAYEKLGDNQSAKAQYEKALEAVNKVKSDDAETISSVQESKTFIEQRLAEL